MNSLEQFRVMVANAISAATAANAELAQLHRILFEFINLDPATAGEAADNLDQLIDGDTEDDLGVQLAPARDLLRRVAGILRG